MNSEELTKLADTYVDAILECGVTRAECIMLLAIIDAKLKDKIFDKHETIQVKMVEDKPKPAPKKNPGIKYDAYDPPPPLSPDPVPPREERRTILAPKSHACTCQICNKVVYTTNKEIFNDCSVEDFRKSFVPMGEAKEIPRTAEIQNLDGSITTDCPLCNGSKSLFLTGKANPGVTSI